MPLVHVVIIDGAVTDESTSDIDPVGWRGGHLDREDAAPRERARAIL